MKLSLIGLPLALGLFACVANAQTLPTLLSPQGNIVVDSLPIEFRWTSCAFATFCGLSIDDGGELSVNIGDTAYLYSGRPLKAGGHTWGVHLYNNGTAVGSVAGSFNVLSSAVSSNAPNSVRLLEVHPDPYGPTVNILINPQKTSTFRLSIVDAIGRSVVVLYDGVLKSGGRMFMWDSSKLPSGSYSVVALTPEGQVSERFNIVR